MKLKKSESHKSQGRDEHKGETDASSRLVMNRETGRDQWRDNIKT